MDKVSFSPAPARQIRTSVTVPPIIYGAAEKTDPATIFAALEHGARAIDTACQPKNYHEEIIGQSLQHAFRSVDAGGLGLTRDQIFIQGKFTTPSGHTNSTIPYSLSDQPVAMVMKSIQMTLGKLEIEKLDVLLMHAPMPTISETMQIWEVMESLVGEKTKALGICNVTLDQLSTLYDSATIKPVIVQNRFWHQSGYDREVRDFCIQRGIVYQAFWVLKANRHLLESKLIRWVAEAMKITPQNALFLAVLSLAPVIPGISILTGTRRAENISSLLHTFDRLERLPSPILEAFKTGLVGVPEDLGWQHS